VRGVIADQYEPHVVVQAYHELFERVAAARAPHDELHATAPSRRVG